MNVLNTYLTKRAMVLPYLAATGGSGTAYYNEGGDLGLVATYNKAPIGNMNFYDMAYTVNDAALLASPPIFKAPHMLSKIPSLGKLGTAIYNIYNKIPLPIKNMAYNSSIISLPYLGAEYIGMNGIVGKPAPKGVVGRYGIPSVQYGYDRAGDYLLSLNYSRYIGPLRRTGTELVKGIKQIRPSVTPIISRTLTPKIPAIRMFSIK